MRPWMIVLSSAAVAIAAAAAMASPALLLSTRAGIVPAVTPLIPTLVVTMLAVYALCAILLTTGNLIVLSLNLRRHLTRTPPYQGPARPDWTAAFAAGGLGRLALLPAHPQPRPARPDGTVVLQSRFRPGEARKEVSRLCYIWAARTHFFSASIALAALVALGLAQQRGPLPVVPGLIPTIPAGLILIGLILLAVLARLAIDVTIDPLIETIAGLPAEPVDVALLRRAVELLESAQSPRPERARNDAASMLQIPDRLVGAVEEGHRALSAAIERLSATTDGLAAITRSSIEALESAFRAAEPHQPPAAEPTVADAAELSQLRQAVVALTAALERVPTGPVGGAGAVPGRDLVARHRDTQPDLADQLKQLLQEVGTTP
jgi:hypothetical protein